MPDQGSPAPAPHPRPAAVTRSGEDGYAVPIGQRWVRVDDPPAHVNSTRQLLARPAGTNRPTVGTFDGQPIESGGRDRSIASDLRHDPLRAMPVTFYQHAESKAAAQMRHRQIATADLVIDNTVCGTNDNDRTYTWTCDKILPSILPPGSRLTVWVTRDGGRTWWRATYVGTGERIRHDRRDA